MERNYNKINPRRLGELLRYRGITAEEAASRSGVPAFDLARILRGSRRQSPRLLEAVAGTFGVPCGWLAGKNEPMHPGTPGRISELRRKLRLTYAMMGSAAGVSRQGMLLIERGEVYTTLDRLERLSAAYGAELKWLVEGEGPVFREGCGYPVRKSGREAQDEVRAKRRREREEEQQRKRELNDTRRARLKRIRQEHGLTQKELAEQLGMTAQYVTLLESGRARVNDAVMSRIEGRELVTGDALIADDGSLPKRSRAIRRIRKRYRLTQKAFADRIGRSLGLVSDMERGEREVSDGTWRRIREAFREYVDGKGSEG